MKPPTLTPEQAEARRLYLVEHRKCLDRVMALARQEEATTAALTSTVIFLFNLAGAGERMPGAICANAESGIDIDAPDQSGGPAAYKITSEGMVTRLAVPKAEVAVTPAEPEEPRGESKLRLLRESGE